MRRSAVVALLAFATGCRGEGGDAPEPVPRRREGSPTSFVVLQRQASLRREETVRRLNLGESPVLDDEAIGRYFEEGLMLCPSPAERTAFLMAHWVPPPEGRGDGAQATWSAIVAEANRRLLDLGPGVLPMMCEGLELAMGDPTIQSNVRVLILAFHVDAVPALLAQLGMGYERLAQFEVLDLDRRHRPPLEVVRDASTAERRLRRAALRAELAYYLGKIADARAWEALADLMEEDPQPAVRIAAAEALARMRDQRIVNALGRRLQGDDEVARRFARDLLYRMFQGDTDVGDDAYRWTVRLDTEFDRVRRPLPLLFECLSAADASEAVKWCAASILVDVAGRPIRDDLAAYRRHFETVDRTIAVTLLHGLDDRAPEVRGTIAQKLLQITGEFFAESDALDLDLWLDRYGFPRLPPRPPCPWGEGS